MIFFDWTDYERNRDAIQRFADRVADRDGVIHAPGPLHGIRLVIDRRVARD
jgi:hypothetical protein